jgi:hypothetical protein
VRRYGEASQCRTELAWFNVAILRWQDLLLSHIIFRLPNPILSNFDSEPQQTSTLKKVLVFDQFKVGLSKLIGNCSKLTVQ